MCISAAFYASKAADIRTDEEYDAGEKVIAQGERGDLFYVVESGTYDAFVNDEVVRHSEGYWACDALLDGAARSSSEPSRQRASPLRASKRRSARAAFARQVVAWPPSRCALTRSSSGRSRARSSTRW